MRRWCLFVICAWSVALGMPPLDRREARGEEPKTATVKSSPTLGSIEGTVTYAGDAKRPWRYVRFYVKQGTSGELAEALVALRGKGLKDAGEPPQPKTVVVDQKNFQFTPELTALRVGDAVKFTNSDQATHNVQATSEIANFNVTMAADGAHTVKLDKAGGIRQFARVGCVFHSSMRAWVFVFDHPFFATTAADGKFRLEGIPPGEYDLELFHPAGALRTRRRVTVKANETTRLDVPTSPDDKEKN